MANILSVSQQTPGAYPTIGDALEAATDGAVISIAAGVYDESVRLPGRRLDLVAAGGRGTVTIGSVKADRPAVVCTGGDVTLRDLVIVSGEYPGVTARGGRLRIEGCTVTASHAAAVIVSDGVELNARDTKVTDSRHGVVIEDAGGLVDKCEISNITDDGIIVRLGADPMIRNCTVSGTGSRGIYVYQAGRPTIERCDISATGDIGILVANQSSPTISHTLVHDTNGVGIVVRRGCGGHLEDCRADRTLDPGIHVEEGATTTIRDETPGRALHVGVSAAPRAVEQEPHEIEDLLKNLDSMIGLANIKADVRALIDEIQVNEWRRSAGLAVGIASHHLIFTGPPGTGKTTVARLYGQLLKALGVLPNGKFKEVVRRDLVGQYVGHTAEKASTVFEEALGGVLFIDEAYALSRSSGTSADFGQEAIDALVKLMEDHRDSVAVIVAGYTAEMHDFLDANSGLASRFAKTLEFQSYGPSELVLILDRIARADDYELGPGLSDALLVWFSQIERDGSFGNAREARRLVEGMRKAQSGRLRSLGHMPARDDLRLLLVDDLLVATRPSALVRSE